MLTLRWFCKWYNNADRGKKWSIRLKICLSAALSTNIVELDDSESESVRGERTGTGHLTKGKAVAFRKFTNYRINFLYV
jgi:hypothetical protein